MDVMII